MKTLRKCKQCGSDFEVDTSRRNWKHVAICSDKCRKAIAAAGKRSKYKPKKVSHKYCENCDKKFQPAQNVAARQKYCTPDCLLAAKEKKRLAKWRSERQARVCAHCGKDFLPERFAGKHKYCSKDCQVRAIHRRHDRKNRRSGSYQQEFRIMRPVVLERDKVCVLCDSDQKLHVHHWDNSGRSEDCNNSLDNLAVLCGDCHSAIHKVTLAKVDGEWFIDGRIFNLVDINDPIPIKR